MVKSWKLTVLFLVLLPVLFSPLGLAEEDVLDINIISQPDICNNGVLEISEIRQGFINIGEVSLVITSTIPWKLIVYIEPKIYPRIKPALNIVEYQVDSNNDWQSIDGQVIKQGDPTNGECYSFNFRCNLLKWSTFNSGTYSFDLTFIIKPR